MGKVRETKGDTRRRKQKHNTIKYRQSAGTFHIILLNYFILTNWGPIYCGLLRRPLNSVDIDD